MDKYQAIQQFWSGFGLTAYDENSVPENAKLPYITYAVSIGALDEPLMMTANLWYRSTSWQEISRKANEIEETLGYSGVILDIDYGKIFLCRGTPFAQRLSDPDDRMIKRIYFNIGAEFLTAH